MEAPKFIPAENVIPNSVPAVKKIRDDDLRLDFTTQRFGANSYSRDWNSMVRVSRGDAPVKGVFLPESNMLGWTTDSQVIHDHLALAILGDDPAEGPVAFISIWNGNIRVWTHESDPTNVIKVGSYLEKSITQEREKVRLSVEIPGDKPTEYKKLYSGPIESYAIWTQIVVQDELEE